MYLIHLAINPKYMDPTAKGIIAKAKIINGLSVIDEIRLISFSLSFVLKSRLNKNKS